MISLPAHVLCFGWMRLVGISRIAQQRVAGSGGVPPSPKLPALRSGKFGYTRDVGRNSRMLSQDIGNTFVAGHR